MNTELGSKSRLTSTHTRKQTFRMECVPIAKKNSAGQHNDLVACRSQFESSQRLRFETDGWGPLLWKKVPRQIRAVESSWTLTGPATDPQRDGAGQRSFVTPLRV